MIVLYSPELPNCPTKFMMAVASGLGAFAVPHSEPQKIVTTEAVWITGPLW